MCVYKYIHIYNIRNDICMYVYTSCKDDLTDWLVDASMDGLGACIRLSLSCGPAGKHTGILGTEALVNCFNMQ